VQTFTQMFSVQYLGLFISNTMKGKRNVLHTVNQ